MEYNYEDQKILESPNRCPSWTDNRHQPQQCRQPWGGRRWFSGYIIRLSPFFRGWRAVISPILSVTSKKVIHSFVSSQGARFASMNWRATSDTIGLSDTWYAGNSLRLFPSPLLRDWPEDLLIPMPASNLLPSVRLAGNFPLGFIALTKSPVFFSAFLLCYCPISETPDATASTHHKLTAHNFHSY